MLIKITPECKDHMIRAFSGHSESSFIDSSSVHCLQWLLHCDVTCDTICSHNELFTLAGGMASPASFEDKRRENWEAGQAVLQKRRESILEQQKKEKEEREKKEKEEKELREKQK